jgi:hypothetical protein
MILSIKNDYHLWIVVRPYLKNILDKEVALSYSRAEIVLVKTMILLTHSQWQVRCGREGGR